MMKKGVVKAMVVPTLSPFLPPCVRLSVPHLTERSSGARCYSRAETRPTLLRCIGFIAHGGAFSLLGESAEHVRVITYN